MAALPETDLILNPDGSVYHLHLNPGHVSDTIIAVGDPERVSRVSRHFDRIDAKIQKREFVTHVGMWKGRRITGISTGIGTDNVEIVLHELDALVNADLKARTYNKTRRKLTIVRIGTSGALQEDIPVDAHLASASAVGLDNLIDFYDFPQSNAEKDLVGALQRSAGLNFRPYVALASSSLLTTLAKGIRQGNTLTSPGFFAPQGRQTRLAPRYPRLLDDLKNFEFNGYRLANFEMETAAYYALGSMMGHEVISLNAIIGNRALGKFSADPSGSVDLLIEKVLEGLKGLS